MDIGGTILSQFSDEPLERDFPAKKNKFKYCGVTIGDEINQTQNIKKISLSPKLSPSDKSIL